MEWEFEPSILLGLGVWTFLYLTAIGPLRRRLDWGPAAGLPQQIAFHLGTLCALIALCSPLDSLGDSVLFSAHMAQHMLLIFAAAPLWLIGTPGWLLRRLVPARGWRLAVNPLAAFAIFSGIMWAWHLPAAYDAALASEPLHIVEHLTFIGAALIGWMPVLRAEAEGGLSTPHKLVYLIPSMFSCTALAALITLAPSQLYPFYGQAAWRWGLSPLVDQQVGGLAMWLPGDMLYLFLIAWMVNRLFDQADAEGQQVKYE